MAAQAVFLVVRGDLFVGRIGFEEGPSPAVTPKWVAWVASFCVLDHHEPDFRSGGPMRVPSRHSCVIRSEDLFHQYGPVWVLASLPKVLSGAGRSVGEMHLVALGVENGVGSERLILIAVVAGLANVSSLVDQIKPVEVRIRLRLGLLMTAQNGERDNDDCPTAQQVPNAVVEPEAPAQIVKSLYRFHLASLQGKIGANIETPRFFHAARGKFAGCVEHVSKRAPNR